MKLALLLTNLMLLGLLSTRSFANENQKLVLTGSSTIAPLILEISKAFERENQNIRIDVQTGGSSRGVADARRGLADIGMASRRLKPKETDLVSHKIAVDGIGIIVHKDLPVQGLTKAQLKDIFTGTKSSWKEFGGPDKKISVVNRAEGRSEVEMFCKYLGIKNSQIKAIMIVGENAQGVKTISRNKNAITYLSVGHALKEAELGVPVKLVDLDGVAANAKTVADGVYPLARPLNLITLPKVTALQKKFIDYAKSKKVYGIIKNQSFVPVAN